MGIGLAQACAVHGLRLICVVDAKASKQNIAPKEYAWSANPVPGVPLPGTYKFV